MNAICIPNSAVKKDVDPVLDNENFGYRWVRVDQSRSEYTSSDCMYHTQFGPRIRLFKMNGRWWADMQRKGLNEWCSFVTTWPWYSAEEALQAIELHWMDLPDWVSGN